MAGENTTAAPVAEAGHPVAADATHATTAVAGEHGAKGVFPPFDPSTFASQLLWLAITFAALYIVLSRIALPKIGHVLDTRTNELCCFSFHKLSPLRTAFDEPVSGTPIGLKP